MKDSTIAMWHLRYHAWCHSWISVLRNPMFCWFRSPWDSRMAGPRTSRLQLFDFISLAHYDKNQASINNWGPCLEQATAGFPFPPDVLTSVGPSVSAFPPDNRPHGPTWILSNGFPLLVIADRKLRFSLLSPIRFPKFLGNFVHSLLKLY